MPELTWADDPGTFLTSKSKQIPSHICDGAVVLHSWYRRGVKIEGQELSPEAFADDALQDVSIRKCMPVWFVRLGVGSCIKGSPRVPGLVKDQVDLVPNIVAKKYLQRKCPVSVGCAIFTVSSQFPEFPDLIEPRHISSDEMQERVDDVVHKSLAGILDALYFVIVQVLGYVTMSEAALARIDRRQIPGPEQIQKSFISNEHHECASAEIVRSDFASHSVCNLGVYFDKTRVG